MTKAQFKAMAETKFKAANPDATNARITWSFVGPVVPFKDGHGTFRNGHFHAEALGYRTRTVFATYHVEVGYMVVR